MKNVQGWRKIEIVSVVIVVAFMSLLIGNILSVENGEGKHPVTLQWVVSDEGREED